MRGIVWKGILQNSKKSRFQAATSNNKNGLLDRLQAELQSALEGPIQTTSRAGGTDF